MANKAFVRAYTDPGGMNAVDAHFCVVDSTNSWVYTAATTVRITINYADNACSIWDKVVSAINAIDSTLIVVNGVP